MFFFSFFTFWEKVDIYNYAIIPWTDTIAFNGNIWDLYAEVYINYSQIYLVTGSDWKKYHCWKVEGTGATYKMWPVYFSWSGTNTYICNDWKRRWYAKLDAGWWIQFDSLEFSGPVLDLLSEWWDFWHSADGFGNGTGYGFSEGIWLWNRNYVSVQTWNVRNKIWKRIDETKSSVYIIPWKKADGTEKANFYLILKDCSGNLINKLWANEIWFVVDGNVFYINGKSWLFFTWWKTSLSGIYILKDGKFSTGVYSILPYSGNFSLWVWWSWDGLKLSNNTYFKNPFDITLSVYDGDSDWKVLIGGQEKGYLDINNFVDIKDLQFVWKFSYDWTGSYIASPWWEIYSTWYIDIKIVNTSDYIDNRLWVYYSLSGKYNVFYNGYLYTGIKFSVYTNKVYFYPDKKVKKINIIWNCSNVKGDWQSICILKVRFKNKEGYNIPFLKIWNLKIKDLNKSFSETYPYRTFDIDEISSLYKTWVFLSGFDSISNNYGEINVFIYSYKPIFNWALWLDFFDLSGISQDIYNRYQSYVSGKKLGFMFWKAVDLYFSGKAVEDGILLWADNNVDVVFKKLVDNISNWSYFLSGTLNGCTDCNFEEGGTITDSTFWIKTVDIVLTWTQEPEYITYYNKYYQFTVDWLAGIKQVRLKPNIKINGKNLSIVWQSYGSKIIWLISRAILSSAIKAKNVAIVGSKFPFSNFVWYVRKYFYINSRWQKFNTSWDLDTISLLNNFEWYYDCWWNIVQLGNWNNIIIYGHNKLFLKDCSLLIKSNIVKWESNAKLEIVDINSNWSVIDITSDKGWQLSSNIYIASSVFQIEADLITDGSIFTLSWSNIDDIVVSNIFFPFRWKDSSIQRQLYIHWKILARNTMGGWYLDSNWKVTLPWWRKFEPGLKWLFNLDNIDASVIAQAYDINFWRANLVNFWHTDYDTGLVAPIILNKYNCQWNINYDPDICYMPIVVEYDR